MQTGSGGIFSFGSGGPVPAGRLRARRPPPERPLLRQGLPERADRHAARDAHARPRGDRDHHRHPRGAALQDPPASHLRARQRRQGDRAARRPPRAARRWSGRKSGDCFNRAELIKELTAGPDALPRRRLRQRRGRAARRSSTRCTGEVDIVVPIRRGPLVHIERIEIKGNTKTRDKVIRREMEIQEGQLFSETELEHSKRRITALGYFERVDVSTEQGVAARQAQRQLRDRREPDRHVPGRRRLQLGRELHRHGAGPAGQPLRQRPVARPLRAAVRPAPARQPPLLRALLLRLATGRLEQRSSSTSSTSSTAFSRRSVGGSAHLRLRAHPARGCA